MRTDIPVALTGLLEGEPAPQKAFKWNREPWAAQMHDLPEVRATLDKLPDRVDRQIIRDVVLAELDAGRVFSAFVPATVWGWGTSSGRGAIRTRWILTGVGRVSGQVAAHNEVQPSVGTRLEDGARSVREDGPQEAFALMSGPGRIKQLGASYFTKWLYFTSAVDGPNDAAAAPIFDKRIRDWLREEAKVRFPKQKTAAYAEYLDLLTEWGNAYGRTPVQVETDIFRLATGRG